MNKQTTLLTSHKGVDLHAATAQMVMKDRLTGGDRLEAIFRCEMHTYWGEPEGISMDRLLDTGRFYNPNKHHFGQFEYTSESPVWFDAPAAGHGLDPHWPGRALGSDLTLETGEGGSLYGRLLGGVLPAGRTPVDVVSFPLGQEGPVLSGVLWRLVLTGDPADAARVGDQLAVARHRKDGMLLNPHMESWLTVAR